MPSACGSDRMGGTKRNSKKKEDVDNNEFQDQVRSANTPIRPYSRRNTLTISRCGSRSDNDRGRGHKEGGSKPSQVIKNTKGGVAIVERGKRQQENSTGPRH